MPDSVKVRLKGTMMPSSLALSFQDGDAAPVHVPRRAVIENEFDPSTNEHILTIPADIAEQIGLTPES